MADKKPDKMPDGKATPEVKPGESFLLDVIQKVNDIGTATEGDTGQDGGPFSQKRNALAMSMETPAAPSDVKIVPFTVRKFFVESVVSYCVYLPSGSLRIDGEEISEFHLSDGPASGWKKLEDMAPGKTARLNISRSESQGSGSEYEVRISVEDDEGKYLWKIPIASVDTTRRVVTQILSGALDLSARFIPDEKSVDFVKKEDSTLDPDASTGELKAEIKGWKSKDPEDGETLVSDLGLDEQSESTEASDAPQLVVRCGKGGKLKYLKLGKAKKAGKVKVDNKSVDFTEESGSGSGEVLEIKGWKDQEPQSGETIAGKLGLTEDSTEASGDSYEVIVRVGKNGELRFINLGTGKPIDVDESRNTVVVDNKYEISSHQLQHRLGHLKIDKETGKLYVDPDDSYVMIDNGQCTPHVMEG